MLEDDDDIYGPPVERRITRTFPSLADELPEKSIPRQDVAQQVIVFLFFFEFKSAV